VALAQPAPAAWTVWVERGGSPVPAGAIAAGQSKLTARAVSIAGAQRVLVGTSSDQPALQAVIPPAADAYLTELSVRSPLGNAALLDSAHRELALLDLHVGFLAHALAVGNVFNVRLHSEHTVNIIDGAPAQDLDGNGIASNPGDAIGLYGQGGRAGYVHRSAKLSGELSRVPGMASGAATAAGSARDAANHAAADFRGMIKDARICARAPTAQACSVQAHEIEALDGDALLQERLLDRGVQGAAFFELTPP